MSFELIGTVEVGAGGAASIEFTSIPQDGTDLVLKLSFRSSTTSDMRNIVMKFNDNSSVGDYSYVSLEGDGSTVTTNSAASETDINLLNGANGGGSTSDTFSNVEVYISDYASASPSSVSSDSVNENNATAADQRILAATFNLSEAISSIQFEQPFNFVEHSTASLYKITAA
jgi:hypothetical protein